VTAVRLYPEFNCAKCDERQKLERGCEQDAPFPYWTDRDGQERSRCPRRPIFEDPGWFGAIISAFNFYKNGFLPHVGGMADQAALYPFIMATIDDVNNVCDKIESEKPRGDSDNLLNANRNEKADFKPSGQI